MADTYRATTKTNVYEADRDPDGWKLYRVKSGARQFVGDYADQTAVFDAIYRDSKDPTPMTGTTWTKIS